MANVGPLAAEIGLFGASLQISMAFASWQHYCTALQFNWASAKLCGVEHRVPPIFGRAAITLGIGPHSGFLYFLSFLVAHSWRRLTMYKLLSSPNLSQTLPNIEIAFRIYLHDGIQCLRRAEFSKLEESKGIWDFQWSRKAQHADAYEHTAYNYCAALTSPTQSNNLRLLRLAKWQFAYAISL